MAAFLQKMFDEDAFSEGELHEEVALEDLDESDIEGDDEDLVTHQRMIVNNSVSALPVLVFPFQHRR